MKPTILIVIIGLVMISGCVENKISKEKYCEKNNDCSIEYGVKFKGNCDAGCFNKKYVREWCSSMKWEAFSPQMTCECINNQCDMVRAESCATDSDCVLTMYHENSCCQLCKKEVITKKEEGIRSSWREENCAEEVYRNCPEEVECMMKEEEARCVNGKCELVEK